MKLQRLFDMDPAELAFRSRQEVFKAVERLSTPGGRWQPCRFDRDRCGPSIGALLQRLQGDESPDDVRALQELLQDRIGQRFFAGLDEDWRLEAHRPRLERDFGPGAKALIERADAVCLGTFDLLGHGPLSFGHPVNWHLDPVSGQESPQVHWSRIDPLDPAQVGDSKVVWELNRHQWLLDLGQAWRLTGDERYARRFITLALDWIYRNPYGMGINWSSALEVAMRSLSWCWALGLFRGSRALTPDVFHTLLEALQGHARFIERYLSRYYSPNTHLTVEALALYTLGTLLHELQDAERWQSLGRRVLLEQLPIQVPRSGVYFEQSTRYQYYTLEIYLQFAILAARNDDALPELVDERIADMLDFLLDLRRPDGTIPQIGDTDGGWLCPLVRRDVGDYRGVFSIAAVHLEDPHYAWAAGSVTQEARCLFGREAEVRWQRLAPQSPPEHALRVHEDGGYVVMRSGWEPDAHHLIFDTGPIGHPGCAGHGHADLLAVQLSAFGENFLVDPGTGCYTTGSPWRDYFRGTAAHNTVRVDQRDQVDTAGPFAWKDLPSARLLSSGLGSRDVFATAEHDAYARLRDPVTHRRHVRFLQPGYWLIIDELEGKAAHDVELRFQFAPLPVEEDVRGWFRARGEHGSLLLRTFSSAPLASELVTGAEEPMAGWVSPNYGRQVPAPMLITRVAQRLPLRLITVLIPLRNRGAGEEVG
ncbi:MAG: alginate lyase family protein [Xanthomonadales bacterium]|jgi:hypothetical protein|nr:alginate lyase family protein [Xanthomonadales bacterium]